MCIHNCKDLSFSQNEKSGMWGKQKKTILKVAYPKLDFGTFLSSLILFQFYLSLFIIFCRQQLQLKCTESLNTDEYYGTLRIDDTHSD